MTLRAIGHIFSGFQFIGVFVIERQFLMGAAFALASGVLTFFGFMHGEAIGVMQTPSVAISYVMVAALLFGCAKFATAKAAVTSVHAPDAEPAI